MICAAWATVGGFGCGVGWRGFRAMTAELLVIHSQRSAADSTPRIAKWMRRIVAADNGWQTWGWHSITVN